MTLFCKFDSLSDRIMKKYNLLHLLFLFWVLGCSKERDLAVEIEDNQTLSIPPIEDPLNIFPCENGLLGDTPAVVLTYTHTWILKCLIPCIIIISGDGLIHPPVKNDLWI